jgi:hypothetical protein
LFLFTYNFVGGSDHIFSLKSSGKSHSEGASTSFGRRKKMGGIMHVHNLIRWFAAEEQAPRREREELDLPIQPYAA